MRFQDLYHGADGDEIVSILKDGAMKPSESGEIFFVKQESEMYTCYAHGADARRGAAFVIKVRLEIPDNLVLKPDPRPGNRDTWILQTHKPVFVEVLRLYERHLDDFSKNKVIEGRDRIFAYLHPKPFHVLIKRKYSFAEGIVGELYGNGAFVCYTLELAWFWNQQSKSCVPPGRYHGFLRHDHQDKWRIELTGIPGNRTHVQIHIGNYPRDVQGCVLVGTSFSPDAVWHSHGAYKKLKDAYEHAYGPISVEFGGILATPWGDFPGRRSKLA